MTEAEWLAATDPTPMLGFLRGKASDSKLRLFAVACCRHIWHLLSDERSRQAVETAERYADGTATDAELLTAAEVASPTEPLPFEVFRASLRGFLAASLTAYAEHTRQIYTEPPTGRFAPESFGSPIDFALIISSYTAHGSAERNPLPAQAAALDDAHSRQATMLRDIFGNPFRTASFDPTWLTTTAVSLAHQMYQSRDFSLMPILADALQDAGCDEAAVLDHCRGEGPHVRGCWVVDLVFGKQ